MKLFHGARPMPWWLGLTVLVIVLTAIGAPAVLAQPQPQPVGPSTLDQAQIRKLEVEAEKLRAETKSLNREPRRLLISAGSIVIVLIGIAIQGFFAIRVAKRQEKVSFEMKAAEIIMGRHSPWAALDAVALLHRMYPRRLSETFVQQFDPALFHGTRLYEIRMKLFEALSKADTDDERERIFKIFESIFPEEEKREWFQNMRRAISSTPAQAAVIRH